MQLSAEAFPLASYAPGTYPLDATDIPDWAASLEIQVERCTDATPDIWPDAGVSIAVATEYSMDGGATWLPGQDYAAVGGIYEEGGFQFPYSSAMLNWLPAGSGRKLRGSFTVSGGDFNSSGVLFISDSVQAQPRA
jgi:hypothetical protein